VPSSSAKDYVVMPVHINHAGAQTFQSQDTSDLRQFGTISLVPKCLTFCVGAEVSLGHFSTSAKVSTFCEGAEVSNGH